MTRLTKGVVAVGALAAIGLVGSAIAGATSAEEGNSHPAKLERAPVVAVHKKAPSKPTTTAVRAATRVRNVRATLVDTIATTSAQPAADEPEAATDASEVVQQDDQPPANVPATDEEQEDEQTTTVDDEAADDAEDEAEDDEGDEVEVEDLVEVAEDEEVEDDEEIEDED